MGLGLLSGADWGKVGGKSDGRLRGAMALSRPHPRPFQDKRPRPQDLETPQRRRRIERRFGRLSTEPGRAGQGRAGSFSFEFSPAGALHPPRRLMPNLSTGAMRNCQTFGLASLPPSPAHYSAASGVLHYPLAPFSHWPVPANYRWIGRASHTSSPATPCLAVSWLLPWVPHGEG